MERILGYTHFQFSVEVENLLEMESIGQRFKVNKNLLNDKASKIKTELLRVRSLAETEVNKIEVAMSR